MPNKKVYIVATVQNGLVDDDCDQYCDIIGVYDTKPAAEEIQNKIVAREPIDGINYDYLVEYRDAVILEYEINTHIINNN